MLPNRGELPRYFATQTHPAIIDKATFDAAQQALERIVAAKPAAKPRGRHPFTGMIICAACGKSYPALYYSILIVSNSYYPIDQLAADLPRL